MSIEDDMQTILNILARRPRDARGEAKMAGPDLAAASGLDPGHVNDAVGLLVDSGLADQRRYMGTGSFRFGEVWITPRGLYEYERLQAAAQEEAAPAGQLPQRPPSPVGSPYGFVEEDWEIVSERKADGDTLYVVMGYQFRSDHYETDALVANVRRMFEAAVAAYNALPEGAGLSMDFRTLAAGYGEHLFNEIARDIISADIAVFEMSDLNPNVSLELGVALTWGVRVLPVKKEGQPRPPSDISGQTWTDYHDNAASFVDPEHEEKMLRMVQRAARKKPQR